MKRQAPTSLALALRAFFAEHMPVTRGLSRHTVLGYRDAIMLLLRFLAKSQGCGVEDLDLPHLTPTDLIAFLDHLESDRGNATSTRNSRLAAIHSFARFAATRYPEHLELCQRLLAVPVKRCRVPAIDYLEGHEIHAVLDAAAKTATADGRRDYALLLSLFNTGARVQEILDVCPMDLQLERPVQVRLRGKGRKERICPLWPRTAMALRKVLDDRGLHQHSTERLFRNHRGEPLTRFGARYLLQKYVRHGTASAPSLARKRVHPHVLRHSAAVHLLQSGADLVSIGQLFGHASAETTNRYGTVNLETKRATIERAGPLVEGESDLSAWRSDASILEWLESL